MAHGTNQIICQSKVTSLYENEVFHHELIPLKEWVQYYEYLQIVEKKVDLIKKEYYVIEQKIEDNFQKISQKYKKIYVTGNQQTSKVKRKFLKKAVAKAYAVG